jgi:exopolysaccharide biosynthesis polyprenyl glycosylphosphotransferase
MSTLSLYGPDRVWSLGTDGDWAASRERAARLLSALTCVCLLVMDLAVGVGAFLLAHWVRFIVPDDGAAALGLEQYAWMGLTVSCFTSFLFAFHGLYDLERHVSWPARLHLVLSSVSTALVISVAVSFFLGDQRFSRLWFAAGWAFAVLGLTLWRGLANRLYLAVRAAVAPANRVLVVGANRLGQDVARELASQYQVVGYVDNGSDLDPADSHASLPLLGTIAQLEQIVHGYGINEVIVALPAHRREQVNRIIARGFRRRVTVKLLPELPELGQLLPERFEISRLAGRPYIGFVPVAKVSWLKRALDVILTSLGLLVLAPLLVAIAIAIKLDSPGPVFYRQERVGKDGRRFWILKFRSMRQDADQLLAALREHNEASGPLFKMRVDPRVTRVGRVLRRLSLDELPQLFNVLKGEMSLVGPRPPIPSEVEQYEDWQHGRLRAMPGITGLWQVSGRSEVPFHDMVRLDLHYIRNWSLGLDLEILWRTIPAVLTSRGAY